MPRSTFLAALFLITAAIFATVGYPPATNSTRLGRVPGTAELAAPPIGIPGASSSTQTAQQSANTLATVEAPGRDLVAITQRLRLHSTAPVAATVNSTPPNYPPGTRQQFYVADIVNKNYYTISATIKEVTAHAYWYVKDGYSVDLAALKASARQFEDHIYVTNRRVFGSEPTPGIDNDPHITILLTPMQAVNGYFSSADGYPKVVNPYSNQRKMIYISSRPAVQAGATDNQFEGTLAHEFQHMIHWNVHRDRDVWLDEGLSEIAMYLNGYNTGHFDFLFSAHPDVQLNAWASEPNVSAPHYGGSYLFLRYLMDRYGGEAFIKKLMSSKGLGTAAVDAAVKASGNPAGYDGAFKDWVIANRINSPGLAAGRYSYAEGGHAQDTRVLTTFPATRSETVHQYAADYIKLSGNHGPATITFKGNPTARVIAADPHSGKAFWYSNRRDSGDATLTRELDLTRVNKATLQFWTWYDIEDTFDYAYVEASTDGGSTWVPLKGKYTTTDNPNGASLGNAFTGRSGVSGSSTSAARWVQESVDLGAFAGKQTQIRFEYITDEGYNAPGLAVDDLRVPEIGYSDDAERDNGWNAQGFVRIGNTLPQKWYVALIEDGPTPRLREMTVNSSGYGTLDVAALGGSSAFRDAVLVVAPLAPKTTETANFSITVRNK